LRGKKEEGPNQVGKPPRSKELARRGGRGDPTNLEKTKCTVRQEKTKHFDGKFNEGEKKGGRKKKKKATTQEGSGLYARGGKSCTRKRTQEPDRGTQKKTGQLKTHYRGSRLLWERCTKWWCSISVKQRFRGKGKELHSNKGDQGRTGGQRLMTLLNKGKKKRGVNGGE